MLVSIVDVQPDQSPRPLVWFRHVGGVTAARWAGDTPPLVGSEHHVELAFEGGLVWGCTIRIHNVAEAGAGDSPLPNGDPLDAKFEGELEGHVALVRIGESLVLVDTKGDALPLGSRVKLIPDDLSLYPLNL